MQLVPQTKMIPNGGGQVPTGLFYVDFTEEVERGAALLDVLLPGWENRVKSNTLDLASTSACMLGQLAQNKLFTEAIGIKRYEFSDYHDAVSGLISLWQDINGEVFPVKFKKHSGPIAYGFLVDSEKLQALLKATVDRDTYRAQDDGYKDYPGLVEDNPYEYLTRDWLHMLKARRSAARRAKKQAA